MAGFLVAELVGRLGQAATWHGKERRYLTFSVAHNMPVPRSNTPPETVWVSCAWFDAPPKITEYLLPGTEVFVRGRLAARTYRTSQDETRISLDITVSELKILHMTPKKADGGGQSDNGSSDSTPAAVPEQPEKTFYKDF